MTPMPVTADVMLAALAKLDAIAPAPEAAPLPVVLTDEAAATVRTDFTAALPGEWVTFTWDTSAPVDDGTMTLYITGGDGMAVNYLYDIVGEVYAARMPKDGMVIGMISIYR